MLLKEVLGELQMLLKWITGGLEEIISGLEAKECYVVSYEAFYKCKRRSTSC